MVGKTGSPIPDRPNAGSVLRQVFDQFTIDGELIEASPHGGGHINDTFLGVYRTGNGNCRYIHQRINHHVFKEPEKVMENIARVTSYARERITANGGDPHRETLTLIQARDGKWFHQTPQGETWRTYAYIAGARTYEIAENLEQVSNAAKAFGRFQALLDSLPGPRLHETIPNFHHTQKRFDTFIHALNADAANRAASVRDEIDFILHREQDASVIVNLLAQGKLPERITHNDTKLNNVLIDDRTGEGICVIDLDTMMPGSALYDFGDLIRMGVATAAEDETNLQKVGVSLELFEHLSRGYLETAGDLLVQAEKELLVFSGRLITYEQAIRFLGDYLNGDTYYKVRHPLHNLERARNQIKMIVEMERKQDAMEAIVRRFL